MTRRRPRKPLSAIERAFLALDDGPRGYRITNEPGSVVPPPDERDAISDGRVRVRPRARSRRRRDDE